MVEKDARERRLAEALRINLRRRKAQARALAEPDGRTVEPRGDADSRSGEDAGT